MVSRPLSFLACLLGLACGAAASVEPTPTGGNAPPATTAPLAATPRTRTRFTDGWRFHRGDAPDIGAALSYEALRPHVLATGTDLLGIGAPRATRPPGNPGGWVPFAKPDFDDTSWTPVRLPHDWAISGPFAQDLPGETGKLPWQGTGWYRKRFNVAAQPAGQQTFLDIDGAMAFSSVWLNGHYIGGWPYGYSSYRLDLTPYLNVGDNTLAIRLDNPPNSSRWYPGSGLYRNVWLVSAPPVRVGQWGVFVTTPRITDAEAIVQVDVRLETTLSEKTALRLVSELFELGADGRPSGSAVARTTAAELELDPTKARETLRSLTARLPQPKRWDLRTPHRYVAVTTVTAGERVLDRVETTFGVRTIAFDADRGFVLNGRVVPLQGVCLHHDLGALGTAVNVRAMERQLEILQSMGCNAIRTSHNPPAPEFLELCDRMGMLVLDETLDAWHRGKKWPWGTPENSPDVVYFDYGKLFDDWHERDVRAHIRRDRNHPSIILWSIGNEVIEQWFSDGWKVATRLAGLVREEDRTRGITSAFNGEQAAYTGFQTAIDVIGFNYRFGAYATFRAKHPTIPVYGSETASTISTRGEYYFPVTADKTHGRANFQVSSYDMSAADWANLPDVEFRAIDETPGTAGEFVWTGFDYLGEPTPYNSDTTNLLNFSDPAEQKRIAAELERLGRIQVPSRSSYFGIIDLAGFPKDRYYLYQARWRPDLPMAHLLPHWNWPERVGQVTPVHVYSSGDSAELFLNGQSLGKRTRGPREYRFRWDDVVYQPGELKVVVTKEGKPWAEASQRTTGAATQLALQPDRPQIRNDGNDLAFVTVRIADVRGDTVPRTHHPITYSLDGPGEIVAVDNGDPTSLESFQATTRKAFNGLALVIVRAQPGATAPITLRASADGLTQGATTITPVTR